MLLVDQHAAHERVTLHRMRQDASERLGAAQRLLTPQIVEMSPAKAALLEQHLDVLTSLHVEVEPYGGGSFAVRAVPPALGKVDIARLLEDIAQELADGVWREVRLPHVHACGTGHERQVGAVVHDKQGICRPGDLPQQVAAFE